MIEYLYGGSSDVISLNLNEQIIPPGLYKNTEVMIKDDTDNWQNNITHNY